jgi:hypothetical protein
VLEAVVAKYDLRIGDDIGGGFTPKGAVMGFRSSLEAGELVIRSTLPDEGVIGRGWEALLDRLSTLDRTNWHDLHICGEGPAEKAIAMGQPFALREVSPVLVDLARVYLGPVWPGGATETDASTSGRSSSAASASRPVAGRRLP